MARQEGVMGGDGKTSPFGNGNGAPQSSGGPGRDTTTDPEPQVGGAAPTDFTSQPQPPQESGALRNETTIPAGGQVLHADAPSGDYGVGSTPASPGKPFKI